MTHSIGPFTKQLEPDGEWTIWTAHPQTAMVATVHSDDMNVSLPAKENADLFGAAPDLLEALRPFAECAEQIGDMEDPEEWAKFRLLIKNYRAARDAVAKAEGRT